MAPCLDNLNYFVCSHLLKNWNDVTETSIRAHMATDRMDPPAKHFKNVIRVDHYEKNLVGNRLTRSFTRGLPWDYDMPLAEVPWFLIMLLMFV